MVLRKIESRIPTRYVFNGAVALFLLGTAALAVRHMLTTYSEPPCGERYANTMLFSWQRPTGEPLTGADLQAKLDGRDWGLLDNVRFVKVEDGPAPVVLEVDLEKSGPRASGRDSRGGMGFRWLPSQIKQASAACLAYSVWLPRDFEFANGGSLPGLYGGGQEAERPPAAGKPAPAFSTRPAWREDAKADVQAATIQAPEGQSIGIDSTWFRLRPGRWVRLEQEIVLNRPGARDGILRIWIDGELKLERTKLAYRDKAEQTFRGVIADAHYGRADQAAYVVGKGAKIRLSPFELRWR
jgi:hypothetical protein